MDCSAIDLHRRIEAGHPPLILDVRNVEEFARWPIEGRGPLEALNLPYFAFIEDEADAVRRVRDWIAGRDRDLVVVCAQGGSSDYVAEVLRGSGLAAANLAGGMRAWGGATAVRPIPDAPLGVWQAARFGRGCLSYVLASAGEAIAVDPHRDLDLYLGLAARQGLRLRAVFDTHLHADHLSGAAALASEAGIPYYAHAADFQGAGFDFAPVDDEAPLRFGSAEVAPLRFLHTPGHTPGSAMLLVGEALLLTGDTLFVGSAGRPDLGGRTLDWGRDLYHTLHRRLGRIPDGVRVLPAHTAGPRESRADGTVQERLGVLRRTNETLVADEAAFLARLEAGTAPAPAHYAKIRAVNLGAASASGDEAAEMELGRNECALGGRDAAAGRGATRRRDET